MAPQQADGHQPKVPDGRPQSPAAERNKEPIRSVLERVLPARGRVLEIASGTGVHARYFAAHLPRLEWQPSEADPALQAAMAEAGAPALPNLQPPVALDVRERPWPLDQADALVCINLTHVAPWAATEALLDGAARLLPSDGVAVIYGPFRRGGRHTAASNEAFDRSLRARDPDWGLRDLEALEEAAHPRGLRLDEVVEMPANNFCLVFRRAAHD